MMPTDSIRPPFRKNRGNIVNLQSTILDNAKEGRTFPELPLAENGKNPSNVDGWSRREIKRLDNWRGLDFGYMKIYCKGC
jgi:hypothetical protein